MADDTRAARQELQNRIASLQQQINTNGASGDINREGSQAWLTNVQLQSDLAAAKAGLNAYVSTSSSNIPVYTEGQVNQSFDTGTNAPVRTLQQTQGIFAEPVVQQSFGDAYARYKAGVPSGTVYTTTSLNQARTIQSPGVGANRDDGIVVTSSTSAEIIGGAGFAKNVTPQPNALDQYASYTYNLSWYLMTPDSYNQLASGKPDIKSWILLVQSGGAPAPSNSNGEGGRSEFFSLDYYMDNLILTTLCPGGGGGTLSAHNGGKLEFTVTEPNGITLPGNLAGAVQTLNKKLNAKAPTNAPTDVNAATNSSGSVGKNQQLDWTQGIFCLVIKFFGYDSNGNLLTAAGANQSGTSSASIIKYYPFHIREFTYRLASRGMEYHITAMCPPYDLNASTARGTIPTNFELTGKTVKDILSGNGSTGANVTISGNDGRVSKPIVAPSTTGNTKITKNTNDLGVGIVGTDKNLANPQGMAFGGGGL